MTKWYEKYFPVYSNRHGDYKPVNIDGYRFKHTSLFGISNNYKFYSNIIKVYHLSGYRDILYEHNHQYTLSLYNYTQIDSSKMFSRGIVGSTPREYHSGHVGEIHKSMDISKELDAYNINSKYQLSTLPIWLMMIPLMLLICTFFSTSTTMFVLLTLGIIVSSFSLLFIPHKLIVRDFKRCIKRIDEDFEKNQYTLKEMIAYKIKPHLNGALPDAIILKPMSPFQLQLCINDNDTFDEYLKDYVDAANDMSKINSRNLLKRRLM